MLFDDLRRHVEKYYGKYAGEVTAIEDEDQQGRVKVKVPSIFGPELAVWARPCFPYGHFFVPAVGSKVWVEFEAGDRRYPIWVGTWYPAGKLPEGAAVKPPERRVIQTASGHTIELHDKEGEEKIVIKHKGNAFLSMDKDGSVILSNQNGSHIYLNAKDEQASFVEQHGNLLSMTKDGAVLSNADGSLLELKGDTVRVMGKNVVVQGTSVALGQGAAHPTILGDLFNQIWKLFATHTHGSAMGPTSPPIPLPPPDLTPMLSAAVTVK